MFHCLNQFNCVINFSLSNGIRVNEGNQFQFSRRDCYRCEKAARNHNDLVGSSRQWDPMLEPNGTAQASSMPGSDAQIGRSSGSETADLIYAFN